MERKILIILILIIVIVMGILYKVNIREGYSESNDAKFTVKKPKHIIPQINTVKFPLYNYKNNLKNNIYTHNKMNPEQHNQVIREGYTFPIPDQQPQMLMAPDLPTAGSANPTSNPWLGFRPGQVLNGPSVTTSYNVATYSSGITHSDDDQNEVWKTVI